MEPTKKIGFHPAQALATRPRLQLALERLFPIRIEPCAADRLGRYDGLILLEQDADLLRRAQEAGVSCYLAPHAPAPGPNASTTASVRPIHFLDCPSLDPRLRGRVLRDDRACALPHVWAFEEGDRVLAECEGRPAWVVRECGPFHIALAPLPPEELAPDECLLDHFCGGRYLALLPLVFFLRRVTADLAWQPPPLRAAFLFDDPNLHAPSYGYIHFRELARHAAEHHYHAAFAMIPLDAWFANRTVVDLFRRDAAQLSLLMHGNNHAQFELGGANSAGQAGMANLAQALCRIEAFERRYGLPVARVMAAPHGECSQEAMRAMLRLGMEGVCISRTHPWLERPPAHLPETGWAIAEQVAGGFPVIGRRSLSLWHQEEARRDNLILRALLNQPLILSGHHDDLEQGFDVLAAPASQINSLGDVRWCSLETIARSNYETRREGDTLRVRLFARRITLDLPEGIGRLHIERPDAEGENESETIRCGHASHALEGTPFFVPDPCADGSSPRQLEIALLHPGAIDPHTVPVPPFKLNVIARRILTETRDRVLPLLSMING